MKGSHIRRRVWGGGILGGLRKKGGGEALLYTQKEGQEGIEEELLG
jgi:hypothetical protein